MGELKTQMERARREAPDGDVALDRLVELRDHRRRNGRLLSAAVALAVTGAMVAGAFVVLGHRGGAVRVGDDATSGPATTGAHGSGGPPSPTAIGPNLVAAPGQFYFMEILAVYADSSATADVWFGQDGSGRAIRPNPEAPGGTERKTWAAGDYPYGDDLSGLSKDPAILLDQLQARSAAEGPSPQPAVTPLDGQRPDTGGLVRAIGDLLTNAPHLLPEQRQALYEVLRSLPTANDLGSTQDPGGRPAVAVRITTTDGETTFFFDPATRLFMSEQIVFVSDDPDVPSTTEFVLIKSAGIVDSDTALPTDSDRFFGDAEQTPAAAGEPGGPEGAPASSS
jgi:hypothetical protein